MRPSSSTSATTFSTSASPPTPLAPPTMTSDASGRSQRGQRAHGDVHPLQRLDPPDEQQHRLRTQPQPERAAGPHPVPGREEGVLDAGRHDLHPARRVAVVPPELALLLRAAHADGVGTADDLHLGQLPPRGLGVTPLGLHPGQGVEGADQGQVQLVLDAVAGHPGQPVVGVDQVGAAGSLQVGDDGGRELAHHVEQPLLRQVGRARRRCGRPGAPARRPPRPAGRRPTDARRWWCRPRPAPAPTTARGRRRSCRRCRPRRAAPAATSASRASPAAARSPQRLVARRHSHRASARSTASCWH